MLEQRSAKWRAARLGHFTASRIGDLMARTKSGPSASRQNLISLLAVERLTGKEVETFQSPAMQRGIALEDEARNAYALEAGVAVMPAGYVTDDTLPNCGCSPDGFVGDNGLVELKCPASMTKHLEALRNGTHADEYRWQLQHQLFVTGRHWVDAVSYDPRFPSGLQVAIKRVFRDAKALLELRTAIEKAEIEVATLVDDLRIFAQAAA